MHLSGMPVKSNFIINLLSYSSSSYSCGRASTRPQCDTCVFRDVFLFSIMAVGDALPVHGSLRTQCKRDREDEEQRKKQKEKTREKRVIHRIGHISFAKTEEEDERGRLRLVLALGKDDDCHSY